MRAYLRTTFAGAAFPVDFLCMCGRFIADSCASAPIWE
jgi:hypothetical protein